VFVRGVVSGSAIILLYRGTSFAQSWSKRLYEFDLDFDKKE
jgi:hypothetical protein